MPRVFQDFSDERNKVWCIHCGGWLSQLPVTRDHTPSKVLLEKPYPKNLAVTPICKQCNNGFSLDEEYIIAFLSCVFSGTTEPEAQKFGNVGKALNRNPALRSLIESQKTEQLNLFGGSDIKWWPDMDRFRRIVVKNARAHLFYENGEPMMAEPEHVSIQPLLTMSDEERYEFFEQNEVQPWGEVGSRWNFRLLGDECFDEHGFVVLQPGVYRFRVEDGGLGIRSIIREYLATTVSW